MRRRRARLVELPGRRPVAVLGDARDRGADVRARRRDRARTRRPRAGRDARQRDRGQDDRRRPRRATRRGRSRSARRTRASAARCSRCRSASWRPESFALALSFAFLAAIVVGGLATIGRSDLRRAVHRVRARLRRGRRRGARGRDLRRRADPVHVRAADGSGRPGCAACGARIAADVDGRRRAAVVVDGERAALLTLALASGCGRSDEDGRRRRRRRRAPRRRPASPTSRSSSAARYPFSGPASAYASIAPGAQAHFESDNAKGGVDGRKIEFITLDDGYEPPRAVPTRAGWSSRRRCSRCSTRSARRTTWRSGTTPTSRRCRTCSSRRARRTGARTSRRTRTRSAGSPTTSPRPRSTRDYLKKEKPNAKVARPLPERRLRQGPAGRLREGDRGLGRAGRREGELRGDRPDDHLADAQAGGLGRRHVPEHHDAEVLGAGDRGDREVRLEAAAHPQQRRRLQDARARAGRASRTPRTSSRRPTSRTPRTRSGPTTRR